MLEFCRLVEDNHVMSIHCVSVGRIDQEAGRRVKAFMWSGKFSWLHLTVSNVW